MTAAVTRKRFVVDRDHSRGKLILSPRLKKSLIPTGRAIVAEVAGIRNTSTDLCPSLRQSEGAKLILEGEDFAGATAVEAVDEFHLGLGAEERDAG
jgi:hypothetical protein